jgi:hypothetical protein
MLQARLQADDMLKRVQDQHSAARSTAQRQLVMDGVLAVVDKFKSAALLAREKDLQAEAHALSRLGHTYTVGWGGRRASCSASLRAQGRQL